MATSKEDSVGSLSTEHRLSYEAIWEVEFGPQLLNRAMMLHPSLHSTAFKFHGQKWKLALLSNYLSESRPIFLYLMRYGSSFARPNRKWHFKLGLKCRDGTEKTTSFEKSRLENTSNKWSFDFEDRLILSRSLLQQETMAALTKNRVTLYARLVVDAEPEMSEASSQNESGEYSNEIASKFLNDENFQSSLRENNMRLMESAKAHERMQEDFKNLLSRGEDSDVVIKTNGMEFPAHRAILRARSPVLKAMFSHETAEKHSGVVNMEDCDPQTLSDFLYYIYTGRCDHTTITNVIHLYTAADKYDLPELKEESLRFMKKKLSVEAFVDFVSLALQHSETELIDAATDYFRHNKIEILKTPSWERFLHENTKEANALLIKALSYFCS